MLKIGDRVKLESGSYCIVIFLGDTQISKSEMVGLELDK